MNDTNILTLAVIGILGITLSGIVWIAAGLAKKAETLLEHRTTAEQRDLFHRIAGEAVAYVGAYMKTGSGAAKLSAAIDYVQKFAKDRGVNLSTEQMRAMIEKAYAEYKSMTVQTAILEPPALAASNVVTDFETRMKAAKANARPTDLEP